MKRKILMPCLIFIFAFVAAGLDLTAKEKLPTLQPEQYNDWERLTGYSINDVGTWVSWQTRSVEGNDTLYIKSLDKKGEIFKNPLSSNLIFSKDGKWAVYQETKSAKEKEKLEKSKKMVKNSVVLMNLTSGEKRKFKESKSYKFNDNSTHLLFESYQDKGVTVKNLQVLDLSTGYIHNIGNVSSYRLNKGGEYLAYSTKLKSSYGNGVNLIELNNFKSDIIASDSCEYSGLSWTKEGDGFSFYKSYSDTGYVEKSCELFVVRDVRGAKKISSLDIRDVASIPDSMRVKSGFSPRLSKDMSKLYFGVDSWTVKKKKDKKSKKVEKSKLAGVDIWHWKDDPIQPRQAKMYNQDKNFVYLYAWNIDNNKIVKISDDQYDDFSIINNSKYVMVADDEPYKPQFKMQYEDVAVVDAETGERKVVLEHTAEYVRGSSTGKYILYFKEKNWWTYEIAADKHRNITANIEYPLWNVRDDHPAKIKPSYRSGSWFADDAAVIIHDEYDIYKVAADGSSFTKLTSGREKGVISRAISLDREKDNIEADEDIYFSITGDLTKKRGYGKVSPDGKVSELIYLDKNVSGLRKAKESDNYLFVEQTYSESPNLFVADGDNLKKGEMVSNTNPQQVNYGWGKSELVDFENVDGKKLQGALFYPANYDPAKKYPMLVYIYEIRSDQLHNYVVPSEQSFYNTTNYTQQGYFVFQPDIVYRTDHPGESAVDCVVPAVEKVLESGMIDKDRVGLMGHSWGAYQTSFIITQTDIFSAAVAGAPLTNMISMYNSIYWNSGAPDQQIFETTQGRLSEPWWKITKEYIDNSPMFQAESIKTPLLVAFGTKDGAVDWHQGIEMYTTMRRMEKPYVMLVYEGENHAVRKKENTLDYTLKINQYFDHYLKGVKAEDWIENGKTYLKKMKEIDQNK